MAKRSAVLASRGRKPARGDGWRFPACAKSKRYCAAARKFPTAGHLQRYQDCRERLSRSRRRSLGRQRPTQHPHPGRWYPSSARRALSYTAPLTIPLPHVASERPQCWLSREDPKRSLCECRCYLNSLNAFKTFIVASPLSSSPRYRHS